MAASSTQLVHRPVRAHPRPVPATPLRVAAPPTAGWAASPLASWLQYLVPLVGSGGSLAFLFAVPGPRPAWLVALVVGAAAASVVAGLALRLVERRAARRARRRYLAHLTQTARQADHLAAAQLAVAEHLHPGPRRLWTTVAQTDRLWERRPTDPDFLTVRIGRGPVPLAAPARLDHHDPLVDHDPGLLLAAEELVRRATWLPDAPVPISLRQLGVLALTGPPDRTRALARAIVCELAAFHAPDDLRILAAHPPASHQAWRWMQWLPHTRDPTPPAGAGPAGAGPAGAGPARARPHVVAILDMTEPPGPEPPGPASGIRGTALGGLLEDPASAGVTVIWLARAISGEPSELAMRVGLDDHGSATLQETAPGGRIIAGIRADAASLAFCETLARRIAPLRLDRPPATATAAGSVRLLDLLTSSTRNARAPGAAAADGGPRLRDRPELLRVPIGVTPRREPSGPGPQGGRRSRHGPPRPGHRRHRVGQERAAAHDRRRPGRNPSPGPAGLRAGRLQGRRRVRRPGAAPAGRRPDHQPPSRPVDGRPRPGRAPGRAGPAPAAAPSGRKPARPPRLHGPAHGRPVAGTAAAAAARRRRVRRAAGRPTRVPRPLHRHRTGRAQPRHAPAAGVPAPRRGPPARPRQPSPLPDLPPDLQRRRVHRRPRRPRRLPPAARPRIRVPQGRRRPARPLRRRPPLLRPSTPRRRGPGRGRPVLRSGARLRSGPAARWTGRDGPAGASGLAAAAAPGDRP